MVFLICIFVNIEIENIKNQQKIITKIKLSITIYGTFKRH